MLFIHMEIIHHIICTYITQFVAPSSLFDSLQSALHYRYLRRKSKQLGASERLIEKNKGETSSADYAR